MHLKSLFACLLGTTLLAAGCPSNPPGPTGVSSKPPVPSKGSMAFGKLPSLGSAGQGAPSLGMMQARSGVAPAAPMMVTNDAAMGVAESSGGGTVGVARPSIGMAKPMPAPIPYPRPRPVTIEYVIEGSMPTWDREGMVLKSRSQLPEMSFAKSFASGSGVPGEVVNGMRSLTGGSMQWLDAEGFTWSFDAGGRNLNAWMQGQETWEAPSNTKPKQDEKAIIAAADRFLDAHGFSAIRQVGGSIQDMPYAVPMMGGVAEDRAMPCIMSGDATVTSEKQVAEPMIYPSPCGWWPQTVTVSYPLKRDGRLVTDAWGNAQMSAVVTIRLRDLAVQGLNVMMSEPTDSTNYATIDQETAKRRLQSGGRQPVYPWGNETKNITVHLKTVELVWIRAEDWRDGARSAYWLPGLRATGTVDRGMKNQTAESYQTVIPLLNDDAFEPDVIDPVPPPIPMPAIEPATLPPANVR